MSRKLTNLLNKGKLTGEEVGQLIIKDMIEAFKQILTDPKIRDGQKQAKGLLTPEQKQVLVNKLDTKEDIRDYNNYRALYDFLTDSSLRLDLYHKEAQVALWRLIHLVSQLKNAEDEYTYTKFNPTIMTQKQYDKLKQQKIDKVLSYTQSIEGFIIHALQYYIELYLKGKKTPYNKHFNKAKKDLITNPRIKFDYVKNYNDGYLLLPDGQKSTDFETTEEWQKKLKKYPPHSELIEDDTPEAEGLTEADIILHNRQIREKYKDQEFIKEIKYTEAPADTTKFDVLERVDGLYYSIETDNINTFWELKKDYPELYKDLIKNISSMKGLEFIKNTPEKDYFNDELIKYNDLINNKILDYEKLVKEPHIDGYWSIAVLQPNPIGGNKIDKEGNYKNDPPLWRDSFRAENFIEDNRHIVISEYDFIIDSLKHAFIIKATFDLIGDFINIPEVSILLNEITFNREVDYLNFITKTVIDNLIRYGKYKDERPAEELKEELKELFINIDIAELQPKEADIKKAKRRLDDFSIFRNGMIDIYNLLWGAE